MKYFLIAGEASGDLHGADLMKGIKLFDKNAEFCFFGGNLMLEQGGILIKHYKEMAFMGLFDVIANIRKITKNIKLCKKNILSFKPDIVILVDYPGFNLRIAEFSHKNNFKTFYYISPKLWAWNQRRAKKIKKYINKMFVIFPFETDFYKKFNYKVEFLGNPTIDVVSNELKKESTYNDFITKNNLSEKPIIALLPGSRKHEIQRLLPEMLASVKKFTQYQFVIAGVSSLSNELYVNSLQNIDIPIIYDKTYELLKYSKAAIVTSGTATLETALFNVPQVVCYKAGFLSYHIGKLVVKIDYFSLVNIIKQKEVVKEFLQFNLSPQIKDELDKILNNDEYRNQMLQNYSEIRTILGKEGSPKRTAKVIVENM